MSSKRIWKDIQALQKIPELKLDIENETPDGSGYINFTVWIQGPEDTPYEGAEFQLRCQMPKEFPNRSPSIVFVTPIWHVNVEESAGSICLDVLNERWTCVTRMHDMIQLLIPQLLQDPNPDDPYNTTAARQMTSDRAKYDEYAKLHTQKYAMKKSDVALPSSSDGSRHRARARIISSRHRRVAHPNNTHGPV